MNTVVEGNKQIKDSNKCLNKDVFYIDKKVDNKPFLIVKVNYEYFFKLTYEDIKHKLDLFHTYYTDNNFTKKIIIILDIFLIKHCLHSSNIHISGTNIMSNIHLINLLKYINDNYNDYIIKCLLVRYSTIDKTIIMLFKQLFKSIKFINKVEPYLQNG